MATPSVKSFVNDWGFAPGHSPERLTSQLTVGQSHRREANSHGIAIATNAAQFASVTENT
jgi:hypothetical protein